MKEPARRKRRTISVITPVFNEEDTVERCYREVRATMDALSDRYDYEHVFADNSSTDRTAEILRSLSSRDPHVKVLFYSRNFGAEKSGFTAMRFISGDACVGIPADLQEPPAMIPRFADLWEQGYEVVYGTYKNPHEGFVLRRLRHLYYWLVDKLSPEPLPQGFSGFGLIDRCVIDEVVRVNDFAPYVRGLVALVGFRQIGIPYDRPLRKEGKSKHGLGFLLGFAMNGIISHSLVPIRLATLTGLTLSAFSILIAFAYALLKIFRWNIQAPGATTTIVLVLFFSGIQLLFLGLLGEYIGAIHGQVRQKPFVVVREKINFVVESSTSEDLETPVLRRLPPEGARTLQDHKRQGGYDG